MAEGNTELSAPPAQAPSEEAPYGYTRDPKTGEMRPRKRAGRSGVVAGRAEAAPASTAGLSPSLDELQQRAAQEDQPAAQEDRVPGADRRRGRSRGKKKPSAAEVPAPPFRAGPIASGMNRIYARIGKVVKAMDRDIGLAIISITRKESPDDITVGEAWEELARTNPRIRVFLLRLIEGGAWTQLFMAHLPIAIAIVMKDGIRSRIPFGKFLGSLLEDDGQADEQGEGAGSADLFGGLLAGMGPADFAQMGAVFNGVMAQAANNVPRSSGMPAVRVPVIEDAEVIEE